MFAEKLKRYDAIESFKEGRPAEENLYQRRIVIAKLLSAEDCIDGKIGEEGTFVTAYCYERPDANEDEPIPSGDWHDRDKSKDGDCTIF